MSVALFQHLASAVSAVVEAVNPCAMQETLSWAAPPGALLHLITATPHSLLDALLAHGADNRNVSSSNLLAHEEGLPDPVRREGEVISFRRVTLTAPDGAMLVRELTFEVPHGRSCLIMGPNGLCCRLPTPYAAIASGVLSV